MLMLKNYFLYFGILIRYLSLSPQIWFRYLSNFLFVSKLKSQLCFISVKSLNYRMN